MRVIFMGTPAFSIPTLVNLVEAGHEVVAVVTKTDKPKGRGKAVAYPPVKEKALEYGFEIYQPNRVKEEGFIEVVREINPDVIVVVAFGHILPKAILEIPKYGCINVHASLLPKLRGAAPIQWAIINGEIQTGITTMFMDEGCDTGDMLMKEVVPIEKKETYGSLHDKLSLVGGGLLIETLKALEEGTAVREKQDESKSTYVKMLSKGMGQINFKDAAIQIERLIRGLNPCPGAYTFLDGKTLKIWDADVLDKDYPGEYGEIVEARNDSIIVKTGEGSLVIKDLQLEGKKRMFTDAFLRGYDIKIGNIMKEW